jgi:hypothetical protein
MITIERARMVAFVVVIFVAASAAGEFTEGCSSTFHHYVLWALGASAALSWLTSAALAIEGVGKPSGTNTHLTGQSNRANFLAALLTALLSQTQLFYHL